uniref:Putative non-specific serine/threonine protein kinase n=2 Tax=Ixodes ricinus TaxID=34613 RepID=A0A6B0VCT7_IXORI
MCACRVGGMQPNSASASPMLDELEDYLHEIRSRDDEGDEDGAGDVYSQLAQKEKDLLLAAEIGKELLERNTDLSRQNERLTEEYSRKLEALEQEKHALRRKLDSVSGESDGRLSELQADLAQARQQLAEQQALLRSLDRERGAVVHEMADQNQRLAQELKAARRAEDQAASQYRSLREQLSLRRSSLDDHVSQLEGLREEITLLSDRKAELERRISALVDERESLSLSLEESGDRILLLEKQRHDYEAQIRNQQRDMEELRVANVQLQERLDAAQRLRTSSPLPGHSLGHRSLFNEIEMSSSSSADDDAASTGRRSRQLSQLGSSSAGFAADLDEIECDECELGSEEDKLRQELAQALQELQRLVSDLRRHRDSAASSDSGVPPSPAEVHPRDVTGHMLSAILADLRLLLQDMLAGSGCQGCQTLAEERAQAEQLRRELCDKSDELRQRSVELSEAQRQLTLHDTELQALHEERDRLRDDVGSSRMAKDEIVKRAWDTRDQAVARKNNTEIELAKTRIELMHINSQLMEAIQQKVELSQQLEQWQVDMQALLDERVKKQLRRQEKEDSRRKAQAAAACANGSQQGAAGRSAGKLFGLWRKSQVPQ